MATQKAKRAARIKLENPSKPMSQVMVEAGYSATYAHASTLMTKGKGWTQLMEEYLPDELLTERHAAFLMADRVIRKYKKGGETIEQEETDPSAVRALDMAYKLKKRYGDVSIGQALIVNVSDATAKKYGINPSPGTDNQ